MKRLFGRVLDAPFELLSAVARSVQWYQARKISRDNEVIDVIASGRIMDGVKDIGQGE